MRAFLRTLLSNSDIAKTRAINEFLTADSITPTDEDVMDIERRRLMDEKRLGEQKQFYEIARKRAADLDVYMEEYVQIILVDNNVDNNRTDCTLDFDKTSSRETV